MRVLFICGSQESGKDGVGDYIRRLACEIIKQGNEAAIIALYDKHIDNEWRGTMQDSNTNVPVYRMSTKIPLENRLELARIYISTFIPDWISLQFVLFTFDKKGLPFGLSGKIKSLNTGKAKWHIMFHELWVAMNEEAPKKQKLWGFVQKQILRSFLNRLKPAVIHTHAQIYQNQLQTLGYNAKILPLFTNLLVDETIFEPSEKDKTDELKTTVVLTLFGGIHPDAPVNEFANELMQYASSKHIKPEIRIVGRTGKGQEEWSKVLQAKNIDTKITGELSSNDVTKQLFTSHYGLSTTSILLVDKSSSVSTMLGHHLPVICVAKPWQIKKIKNESPVSYLFDYKPGNLSLILDSPYCRAQAPSLLNVSKQFILDLGQSDGASL